MTIQNTDRSVGARLSGFIAKTHGNRGMDHNRITIELNGTAGQSFGVWNAGGLKMVLTGDANDYVGKGMTGSGMAVMHSMQAHVLGQCVTGVRNLNVRTNADQPDQAAQAIAFGAEGIGLCRTEHMFFGEGKIEHVQAMILSDSEKDRKKALRIAAAAEPVSEPASAEVSDIAGWENHLIQGIHGNAVGIELGPFQRSHGIAFVGNSGTLVVHEGLGVQSQRLRQRIVENHEFRCTHWYWIQPDIESLRQQCVAAPEFPPGVRTVLAAAERHRIHLSLKV